MLTPEMLQRIRRIDLQSRRLVQSSFAGAYESVYKGRGLEFAAVRPYEPGDDVRNIDWNVTARTGETFIRQYVEERELTLMPVLDGSASLLFGTVDRHKRDFAAEIASVLAYMATLNNDRAGLMIFTDKIEHYVPPRKGRNHIQRIIRDLLSFEPVSTGTDMNSALQSLNRTLPRGSLIFLLSDFLMPEDSYYRSLIATGQRHSTAAIVLSDPLEERIPAAGLMHLRDVETGDMQLVDTSSEKWQAEFRAQNQTLRDNRDALLRRAGISRIDIPPDGDYIQALMQFFARQFR